MMLDAISIAQYSMYISISVFAMSLGTILSHLWRHRSVKGGMECVLLQKNTAMLSLFCVMFGRMTFVSNAAQLYCKVPLVTLEPSGEFHAIHWVLAVISFFFSMAVFITFIQSFRWMRAIHADGDR